MITTTTDAPASTRTSLRGAFTRELDPADRHLLLMWHADHLTPAEIALVLDTTPEHVEQRYERIVSRLRAAAA